MIDQRQTVRERLCRALEVDLMQVEAVRGVFYGGSVATGETDTWSDIDVRIVVDDASFSAFIAEKQVRPERWGNVLFYEDPGKHLPYTIIHYRSFVKIDCFYYRQSELKPDPFFRSIWVVYDPDETLAALKQQSAGTTRKPSAEDVERWRGKVFAYLHEIRRRTERDEQHYARQCADMLSWSLAAGWLMARGDMPDGFGSWSKLEGPRSRLMEAEQKQLQALSRVTEPIDRARLFIPMFLNVHSRVCASLDMPEKRDWVEEICRMIDRPFES
ncbi:nucleotidyltransferase domain-containing protein [Alkalicoccus luteus]|uniref:nucleotidyltransferase domain-containing protein n=1 Tax=Alkalicoccus luteus TaxID=1237094 RepID=UPI004034C229